MTTKKKQKKEKPLSKIEKKRVEILQDAIKQVQAEKFAVKAANGYVTGEFTDTIEDLLYGLRTIEDLPKNVKELIGIKTTMSSKDQLQKYLDTFINKNTCKVCARGALLLSDIRKNNHCTLDEAHCLSDVTQERTADIFGKRNAELMECVFENSTQFLEEPEENEIEKLETLCNQWSKKYKKDSDRVIAIFKNAIRNRGIFVPEQLK